MANIESIKMNAKDEITIIYQFVKGLVPNINIFGKNKNIGFKLKIK